ncbi:MAG: glycoside hydrolase family 36 N-terminal domain-containing protein, partial [Dictyoglomus turgidum]
MPIIYDRENNIFHLMAGDSSYIIKIFKNKYPVHLYWGKRLNHSHFSEAFITSPFGANPDPNDKSFTFDRMLLEYPSYGNSDFRHPAFQVEQEDGSRITHLVFNNYRIYKGKPKLEGLPATYVEDEDEAETLELELADELINLRVILLYTVYKDYN